MYSLRVLTAPKAHNWATRGLIALVAIKIALDLYRIGSGYSALDICGLMLDWMLLGLVVLATRIGHRAEARFRQLFDSNLIGYAIADRKGRILEANDYYLNIVGLKREELAQGHSRLDFTPEEHQPAEKEYRRRDGSRVWGLVGAIRDSKVTVSYVMDISARKRAERELSEAKAKLEENVQARTVELVEANRNLLDTQNFLDSVIENLPNMIFIKNAECLRFVRVNRAGEQLLGRSRIDLLGKNDYDFFPKEQADFFTAKDREVLNSGSELDIPEEPIQTSDGTRILHTRKIPIQDEEGNPLFLLGISEDITEKKQADAQRFELMEAQAARTAAERSNRRLSFLSEASSALNESLDIRSLLNAFSRVIVKHMADWCVIDLYDPSEQTIERMVCTANQGSVPQEIKDWWQKRRFDPKAPDGIAFVLRTGQSRIYNGISREALEPIFEDKYLVNRILEWGITSSILVPLNYHGRILGTICFILCDHRRDFDEFDLPIAEDLARRAAMALENARLFNKASEASRAKSAFLANISHEIRTPLGAMLGFAELVLDAKNLNAEQQTYIATIARNGRQLLRLVDEILDLSKVESERIQIEHLAFSLSSLLSEVQALMLVKANEKGLLLTMSSERGVPDRIVTDPLRLRQILINVIGNAIKFTEKGSITVRASFHAEKSDPTNGTLEVSVTDTGIGMDENNSAKVFQPFVQADGTMSRRYGGTGLGLFLARKLARLLGGDVLLRSTNPGRGSEFAIQIAVSTDAGKTVVQDSARNKHRSLAPVHATSKILLVDDSADNRMLITAFLARPGLSLDQAENGLIAVEKALNNSYDLILMDIQMPEMDGYEAVKILHEKGYRGPVVALTAHAMKGDRERCLEAGFNDYLCKPVTRQSLMELLNRHLMTPPASATIH